MRRIMNSGKPLFLVGTLISGHVVVTDLWSSTIVTASKDDEVAGLDGDQVISATVNALTECGFPITRVVDRTAHLNSSADCMLWSMHGPATYSDFKIEYDPELNTAALVRTVGNEKNIVHAWTNVDGPEKLEQFLVFAIRAAKKHKHTMISSVVDDEANMQLVTYRTPLTVCKRAILFGGIWQVMFCTLSFMSVSCVLDLTGILTYEQPIIPAWFAVMVATFFAVMTPGTKIAETMQGWIELVMAYASRKRPRDHR